MATEETKDLTKKENTALSTELGISKADIEQMYGGMEQDDVTVPRIVMLQGLSPEVAEGKGRPGELYVKGFERNLGKEPVEIVIIMRSKSRIRWKDIQLGGGILCQSPDAKQGIGDPGVPCDGCQYADWQGIKEKPECDLYQNVILVVRKDEDWIPMALSGNRTKLKPMKNLNSLLMLEMTKGRAMFSKSYMLEPIQRQNATGLQYFSYRFSPGNNNALLPIEEQKKAAAMFNSLKGKKLNIVEEQEDRTAGVQVRDDI